MTDENNATGAWTITRVFSKAGVPIDVKTSGINGIAAVDDLYSTIAHGIAAYGWVLEQRGAPTKAAAAPDAGIPVAPGPGAVSRDGGSVPASVPGPAAVPGLNTLEVTRVKVVPMPDDKVELQLFAPGHKFVDLYHHGKVSQVLGALAFTGLDWRRDQLLVAREFNVSFLVDWRESEKTNAKGRPYKDVVAYRPIDAAA